MKTYKEFQPTAFDPRGICLDDRQDWIVAPVSQTRDSGCLDQSNFAACLKVLGGESDTVEVHRFGHWGPGWFEIIIAEPTEENERLLEEIEGALSDYPILDESDHSEREWNAASDYWVGLGRSGYGMRERIEICSKFHASIFAARRDEIPESVDTYYLADGC